jgi:hypothetical protein
MPRRERRSPPMSARLTTMSVRWQRIGLCLLGLLLGGGFGVSVAFAANLMDSHRGGVSTNSSSVAHGSAGCEEPMHVMDKLGTVGRPFSFVGIVECLPRGDTWSNPVIHWGDGTTSRGVITAVGSHNSPFASVTVKGQHIYRQPGGYPVQPDVTDRAGQTYEGAWRINALINAASRARTDRSLRRCATSPVGRCSRWPPAPS